MDWAIFAGLGIAGFIINLMFLVAQYPTISLWSLLGAIAGIIIVIIAFISVKTENSRQIGEGRT